MAEQAIIEDLDVPIYNSVVATSLPAFVGVYGAKTNNFRGAGRTNTGNLKFPAYGEAHLELTGKVADNRTWGNAVADLRILEQSVEGVDTLVLEVVMSYSKKTPLTRSWARNLREPKLSKILVGWPVA